MILGFHLPIQFDTCWRTRHRLCDKAPLRRVKSSAAMWREQKLALLWDLLLLLGRRAARKVDRLAVLVLQRAKELPLLTLVLCERLVERA